MTGVTFQLEQGHSAVPMGLRIVLLQHQRPWLQVGQQPVIGNMGHSKHLVWAQSVSPRALLEWVLTSLDQPMMGQSTTSIPPHTTFLLEQALG